MSVRIKLNHTKLNIFVHPPLLKHELEDTYIALYLERLSCK